MTAAYFGIKLISGDRSRGRVSPNFGGGPLFPPSTYLAKRALVGDIRDAFQKSYHFMIGLGGPVDVPPDKVK